MRPLARQRPVIIFEDITHVIETGKGSLSLKETLNLEETINS